MRYAGRVEPARSYELVFIGTCPPPIGRPFGGPIEPQFEPGTRFPLEVGRRLVMGRARSSDILVDSLIAARNHVAVTLELAGDVATLHVSNLGAGGGAYTAGTYFDDDVRLAPGRRFELGGVLVFEFRRAQPH